jgi:membrane protease YdiL (CAAX protease family)
MQTDLAGTEFLTPIELAVMAAAAVASVSTLFYLFQRHIGGRHLVDYEPRRPVPWGWSMVLVVLALMVYGLASGLSVSEENIQAEHTPAAASELDQDAAPAPSKAKEAPQDQQKFILTMLGIVLLQLALLGLLAIMLNLVWGADALDLGLPTSSAQFWRDVRIGVVACLAAMVPIYVVQFTLMTVSESQVEHPLVEELRAGHTPQMLLAALFMVVVGAPLGEEFLFRLVLQGWLERCEDRWLGVTDEQPVLEGDATPDEVKELLPEEPPPARPAAGMLPILPHGWLPIVVSSVFFGLAHLGHGVAPVPLVLFGIVLGYVYHRTHRLVPSITAHALFNGYSMLMLWLHLQAV